MRAVLSLTLIATLSLAGLATTAAPAEAATINVTAPQAQMANHIGWAGETGNASPSNDDRYRFGSASTATITGTIGNPNGSGGSSGSPNYYSNGYSGWVSNGTTAWSAHGYRSSGGNPSQLDLGNQSALGFEPSAVTQIETGTYFNLGRMVHSNNPLSQLSRSWFRGDLNIRFMGVDMSYRWRMHETDNNYSPTSNPRNNDLTDFLNQVSDQTFTNPADGLTYTLVVHGFTATNAANDGCVVKPASITTVNQFSTVEGARTYGCLYASVEQVRPVTVKKVVVSPYGTAPAQNFAFTSTSTLAGAPWSNGSWTLANGASRGPLNYNSGEQITITEGAQTGPWAFTSLSCVDGSGASVGTVSGQTVTIPKGTTAATTTAAPITCTYTNTYTPRATLTLVKSVNTTGQPAPVAVPADWTLTAQGSGTVAGQSISGASGSGNVTAQSVIAGTYALSELAVGANTGGYVQDGNWTCTNNVSVNASGQITLTNGQATTCTVTNKYQTGSLAITKTVTSTPAGGYTQGTGKAFTAQYVCTTAQGRTVSGTTTVRPNATNGQPGAVATVTNLPANASCVVTELNSPSGSSTDLVNGSWVWGDAAPASQAVTIPAGGTATANITNPVMQNTGSLVISKVVTPRASASAAAYTGGAPRTFPISYTCSIGATTTASGTVNVANGQSQTVGGIPATSNCVVAETLSAQAGDFVDPSFSWDGNTIAQPSATIPANGTRTATVTNYFKRDLVNLTIAKRVDGSGYSGGNFSIDWSCGQGDAAVRGTAVLAGGASQTVSVPAGVACTIVEDSSRPSLAEGYVWGDPSYEGLTNSTVTVPKGETRTVTVVNPTAIGFNRISLEKQIAHFAAQVASGTEFDVRVSCDAPARGETGDYSHTFTFTTPLAGPVVTPYLPIGTSCTVVETALPSGSAHLPGASYAWVATPSYEGLANGKVTVPASTTPAPVKVINDIVRVYGPLAITKHVTKPGGVTVSASFTGTWSCTFGGQPLASGTWTAPASGGAATLTGNHAQLLVGSLCTVTENAPANPVPGDNSYVWAVEIPSTLEPITTDGVTATVRNTLNRTTGSFSVTKSVDGGTAGTDFADTDFAFDYTCRPLSGDPITGVLKLKAGESASPSQEIPIGSTCEVTERTNALPDPVDPNRWDGVNFSVAGATGEAIADGIRFTTPDEAATVAVTARNTMSAKTGSVAVTKSVTQLNGGFVGGSSKIFPMTLTCADPRTGASAQFGQVQSIANGGTATWSGIPVGAKCSVQEGEIDGGLKDASFAWNSPTYSHSEVTVPTNGTPTITVTNTLRRVYGEISLKKIFDDGDFPGVVDTGRSYAGTWACTYDGSTVAGGTWNGAGSTAGTTANLIVTQGNRSTIPLSSSCTATENALSAPSATDGSYRWLTPIIAGINSVDQDTSRNVLTVTNKLTRDTGSVLVEKKLTGETAGFVGGDDFEGFPVGVVCALDPADLTSGTGSRMEAEIRVEQGADPVTLISGVPRGWTCAANEGTFVTAGHTWLFDGSYAWGAPRVTVGGTAGNFVVGAEPSLVTVTNPITRVNGTIEIAKQIAAEPGVVNDDASFSGAYRCVYAEGVEGREATFSGTWTRNGAGVATLTGDTVLPLGTACSITEITPDDTDLIDASWTWDEPAITPESASVTADGPASFTVTNTPKRVYTSLEITKALEGPAGGFTDPNLTVEGSWNCVYGPDDTPVGSGRWEAPATGGAATLDPADPQLPVTSRCTVSEDTLDPDVFKDASYGWGAPPEDQTVTLEAGTTASVTMTNVVERLMGTFSITKLVDRGEGVTVQVPGTDVTYTGTYECSYGDKTSGPLTWSITGEGNSFTAPDSYPASAVCKVLTENRPSRDPVPADASFVWGPPQLGADVTVVANQTGNTTVTNPVSRLTGTFGVTKVVAGDTEGLPENPLYAFEWECVADNGDTYPTDPDEATFKLAAGELWSPSEVIPYGSSCTVTEKGMPTPLHPSFTWSTVLSVSGADGVQEDSSIAFETPDRNDPPVLVTATNTLTRGLGSFSVTKDVPEGSVVDEGMTFTGEYLCTGPLPGDSTTGTWGPIEAGKTWTSDPTIPLAAECEVTSEDRPVWPNASDHADQWDGDPLLGDPVVSATEPATITVTNSTAKVLGSVIWAKVIAGTTDRLAGSIWTLTGPGVPDGIDVTDCLAEGCPVGDFLDQNPAPGEFLLENLEWGEYSLVEKTAPAGYYPDAAEHPFVIGAGAPGALDVVDLGDIENTPINPPVLPLTGGLGRDFFTIAGLLVLVLGLGTAIAFQLRNRRKQAA